MTVFRKLVRDQRGAGVVEFAIALPVLITMIWGVFQIGLVMQANAGMQHALGEAARYATHLADAERLRDPGAGDVQEVRHLQRQSGHAFDQQQHDR